MNLRTLLAAGALGMSALLPAHAQSLVFNTTLSGPAEAPPNSSPGTGTATVTIDQATNVMSVEASFSGLTAPTTVAHIHCCTAVPNTGTIPPATGVPTFPGFPPDVTEGTYSASFSLLDETTWNPVFVTASGGTIEGARDAFVAGLQGGTAYFNIHTTAFPGGEIRGFMQGVQVAPIPEPETYALMLAGLVAVGWAARRRRN